MFKKGDKVAALRSYEGLVAGRTYVIESEARKTFCRWWNLVDQRNEWSSDGSYQEDILKLVTAPKFKVGDRVRSLTVPDAGYGVVLRVNDDGSYQVKYETWFGVCRESGRNHVLVTPAAIVCLIENGQPLPATRPHVHASVEDATKEAARLASTKKGHEFGVYELVATRREERTYEHEWQRLAAEGRKIDAIKAIRAMTGFGLKASKDGIEDWLTRYAA